MKVYLTVIGFVMFFLGFLSLVLGMIGLKLSFLSFIDNWGSGLGFFIEICLLFGGMILFYTARTLETPIEE